MKFFKRVIILSFILTVLFIQSLSAQEFIIAGHNTLDGIGIRTNCFGANANIIRTLNFLSWDIFKGVAINSNFSRIFAMGYSDALVNEYIFLKPDILKFSFADDPIAFPSINGHNFEPFDVTVCNNDYIYIVGNNSVDPALIKMNFNGTILLKTNYMITNVTGTNYKWNTFNSVTVISNDTRLFLTCSDVSSSNKSQYIVLSTDCNISNETPQDLPAINGTKLTINDACSYEGIIYLVGQNQEPKPGIIKINESGTSIKTKYYNVVGGILWLGITSIGVNFNGTELIITSSYIDAVEGAQYITLSTNLNIPFGDDTIHLPRINSQFLRVYDINRDIIKPRFSILSHIQNNLTNNNTLRYSVNEALSNGSITWTRTSGVSDPGSPWVYTFSGTELDPGLHVITPTDIHLVSGTTYTVTIDAQDISGNRPYPIVFENFTYKTNTDEEEKEPEQSLDNAVAGPNPFKKSQGSVFRFEKLTAKATIDIYTIMGRFVKTINDTDGDGKAEWDLTNKNGQNIAEGVYLCKITSEQGEKKVLKIVIGK